MVSTELPSRSNTENFLDLHSWVAVGQLLASVALNSLNETDPYNFRTAIYTQVGDPSFFECRCLPRASTHISQWAMIEIMLFIFLFLPESPWWLASRGKLDSSAKVLRRFNGHLEGYSVSEQMVSILLNS
jgi:MFS transporter, SP family, general alpha glucoside:H+ symporter